LGGIAVPNGSSGVARSMTFVSVDVVGSVERRRRFTTEQKLTILSVACLPGANLSAVARKYDLVPSQVFKWRRLARLGVIGIPGASELPSLVVSEMTQHDSADSISSPTVSIEIVVRNGWLVRVDRHVDSEALQRVLRDVGSLR
jgi:transposase